MFFQINVTPKEKKVAKSIDEEEKAREERPESFTLVLAPFQPQTRIKLQSTIHVPVKCSLCIKNPSDKNINVTVVKAPPKERSMEFGATEILVKAESSEELDIRWTPREVGSRRDTLQLLDSRRIKYNVALITTADGVKKARGQGKSRVLCSSNVDDGNGNCARERRISPPRTRGSKKNASSTRSNVTNVPSKRPRLNFEDDNKENARMTDRSCRIPDPHDFSAVMNSTKFNLTPLKASSRDDLATKFSPRQAGILSPEMTNVPRCLRRETYTAAEYRKCIAIEVERDKEDDDNFIDSLSPRPDEQIDKQPSEFSLLINDMNFVTPNKPVDPSASQNFSPKGCSTGNRTRSVAKDSTPDEASTRSRIVGGNNTFDVSPSNVGDNSRQTANGTYELSPSRSTSLEPIKPTRLSKSFGTMSPVIPIISGESSKSATPSSSSPICREAGGSMAREYSTRASISHISQRIYDDASVKQVLEADLWAKPEAEPSATFSASSLKGRCASLERIEEEETSYTGFDRTKTLELPKDRTDKSSYPRLIEISPPNKYSSSGNYRSLRPSMSSSIRRVSPTKSTKIRKEKNILEPVASLRKRVEMNCSVKRGRISISGVRIANLSLAGSKRGGAKEKMTKSEPKEGIAKLRDSNDFVTRFWNPEPFGGTTSQDPFLTSGVYYDDEWMHRRETEFKKWLNALLTPPEDLSADVDTIRVDVGKVWQSCRAREDVALAETREAVSARYHTDTRLNALRKAACAMFRREEVASALSKATICVERGNLIIRQDRDLNRDIGLQKEILELFLSYNPLWLRIGLETVYGETIPLHSNNDLVGLTRFLITRFFSDPFIAKTHSHSTTSSLKLPTFAPRINKFILKKFLLVVYFLDYAKRNKLIGHDPCLFHKRASHKESRAILLTFSREVLGGVGDVTKVLRAHGYAVSHKQTCLDEYDYAVKDIAVDLRDGVRLCRVMELITGDKTLTRRCRVPAISRLQKVHNADVALGALLRCGYTLTGDIDAKSVADGHREKTLSVLWQIIYKYQAPRFHKAASSVQRWWRSKLWYVRIRKFLGTRRDNAASTIQRAWRCRRARETLDELRSERARFCLEREKAVRAIQLRWNERKTMFRERRKFLVARNAAVQIQRWFRRIRETAPFVNSFRARRQSRFNAAVTIQSWWRRKLALERDRNAYILRKMAATTIQLWWRGISVVRSRVSSFSRLRAATIVVQRMWRIKRARRDRLRMSRSVASIEHWYGNLLASRAIRRDWLKRRSASLTIQKWWRNLKITLKLRNEYREYRRTAIAVQARWRSKRAAERTRFEYCSMREAAIKIQATRRMIVERRNYVRLLDRHRAATILQKRWGETLMAKRVRKIFVEYRLAVVAVQNRYRALRMARDIRNEYLRKRRAAIIFQKYWKMQRVMRQYGKQREAAVAVQSRWRSAKLGSRIRALYVALRNATVRVQRRYRAKRIGLRTRRSYAQLRLAVLNVQRRWRANRSMKREKIRFDEYREAAILVQSKWRMILKMRTYRSIRRAVVTIQIKWRATVAARKSRTAYLTLRASVLLVQRRYRANVACRIARGAYAKARARTILIQRLWRKKLDNRLREEAAIKIQTRWRSFLAMRQCKRRYRSQRVAALVIQRRYRARELATEARREYARVLLSIVRIQRVWRRFARQRRREERLRDCKKSVFVIENWWVRVTEERRIVRAELELSRKKIAAATKIQTAWRGHNVRMHESSTMRQLRERSRRAAEAAVPSATVAFQMQESINIFRICDTIGQLSMCLVTLDTLTRLTPKGCIAFCQLNLVDKIYGTLAISNRSLPWIEVCVRCTNILITLTKLPDTRNYVYRTEYIETLARLMNITVEKHVNLFLRLATLVWLLAENPDYAEAIASCPRTVWLLGSLHGSINKKKSRLSMGCLDKSRGNAQVAPLPSSKPDWGLRQKRPRLFTTVHHAISSLIKRLKIETTT